MGQATADLPPPTPQQPGAPTSADDLLSQLAGEEIDKLLAEADAPQPAPSVPVAHVEQAQVFPSLDSPHRNAGPVAAVITSEKPVKPEPQPAVPEVTLSATELDAALEAVTQSAMSAIESLPTPAAPIASPPAPSERAALHMPDPPAEERSAPVSPDDDSEAVPLYLKPLEWISAPLMLVPESWRDIVGRIAIITFFNAVAVLVYLFFFRK